jgi:hypothetical protein
MRDLGHRHWTGDHLHDGVTALLHNAQLLKHQRWPFRATFTRASKPGTTVLPVI